MSIIPLVHAVLCEDCHNITEAKGHQCPACGSCALVHLGRLIDRDVQEQREVA